MKKTKKHKKYFFPKILKNISDLGVLFMLSILGMKCYSGLLKNYRENKITEQIYDNLVMIKDLFANQDNHSVINTDYYKNEWIIIPPINTSPDLYQDFCHYSGVSHENGSHILYCDNLLFGKDFIPDYAATDYRDLQNIYGGSVLLLLGKEVCKTTNGSKHLCMFVRFSDLPPDACTKVLSHDWRKSGVDAQRINNSFDILPNLYGGDDYKVDDDMSLWTNSISPSDAKELCNMPNNIIDFIIYKY